MRLQVKKIDGRCCGSSEHSTILGFLALTILVVNKAIKIEQSVSSLISVSMNREVKVKKPPRWKGEREKNLPVWWTKKMRKKGRDCMVCKSSFFFCWMLLPGPGISRFNSWKNMKSFPMSKVNFQIPLEMRVSKNIFSKKRSLFWPLVLKHKWVNKGDECHVYPMCDISFPKPLLYFTTLQNYFTAHVHLDYLSFCELLVF